VPKNDGTTVYKLHVMEVPVDAFWSVSVYNAAGYFVAGLRVGCSHTVSISD
jgi:hypothetical protein